MHFNDMPFADGTKDAIAAMGYETPTPIQAETIPLLMEGKDVIGQARTGTGKTAAFGIPLVEDFRGEHDGGVVGLVLVPTRELANQVSEVLVDLAKGSRIEVVTIFGGTGFDKQIRALRRKAPTVLVATPGRLLDLMGRGDADLSAVRFLVLDEADRMLDMGFIHDVRRICRAVPERRQTALFSATLDERVRGLVSEFMMDPVTVRVESGAQTTDLTEQHMMRVEKADKLHTLLHLLHVEQPHKGVVFTRTKHLAKRMADRLSKSGWASVALQGNMTQNQRDKAMSAFRDGKARLLVATDVAARGLDVPDITHVVNFDLPNEPEQYVHRIGRTGRNGRTGRSFTFVQSDQVKDFKVIEQIAGHKVPVHEAAFEGEVPTGPDTYLVPAKPKSGNPRPKSIQPSRSSGRRESGRGSRPGTGGQRSGGQRPGGPRSDAPRTGGQRSGGQRSGGPRRGSRS